MVPFIKTVGLTLDDIGKGTATTTLPARKQVNNHLGTAHAGAVYTLGESASGGAVLSLFADQLPGAFVALKASRVEHIKAATGDVVATAAVVGDVTEIRAGYDKTGKADFDVDVTCAVGDVQTAHIVYTWAVRKPR